MPARSRARKRALDVLYEAELRRVAPEAVLAERIAAADPPVPEYAVSLVEGYLRHAERIDELLAEYSVGWTLERMPAVDRNVLRLGAYELLYADEVPDAVAVSEAVYLARSLSTEESPSFVNGLLGKLLDIKPTLVDQ